MTEDILTLLDAEYPGHGNFAKSYKELEAARIRDALDIASWEVCFLATLGKLGQDGARILRKFTEDKILVPLDLLETRSKSIKVIDELTDAGGTESGYIADIEDAGEAASEVKEETEEIEVVSGGESTDIEEIEGWGDVSHHAQEEM